MSNSFEAIDKRLSQIEHLLQGININLLSNTLNREDTIDIDQAAKILHLAKATVYIKTHKKLLPHFKRGRMLLFSRAELEEYVKAGRVKTIFDEVGEQEKFRSGKISRKRV